MQAEAEAAEPGPGAPGLPGSELHGLRQADYGRGIILPAPILLLLLLLLLRLLRLLLVALELSGNADCRLTA